MKVLNIVLTCCSIPLTYAITLKPRSRVTNNNQIILAPSSIVKDNTVQILQPIDNNANKKQLFIPESNWKVVANDEVLPRDGLDIRINMETGLKEAKLSDNSVIKENEEDYSFTTQFNEIYKLINNGDYSLANLKLDDLLEFVHDYKYGHDIITHEWATLSSIFLNDQLPSSLREIVLRLIISGMRNNPPVIEYIRSHSTNTLLSQLFHEINSSSQDLILIKRFITFLEQYLTPIDITPTHLTTLYKLFTTTMNDKQLNWKILQIVSKFYNNSNNNNFIDFSHDSMWFDLYMTTIQDSTIDEWQLRTFFNTLYNIKSHYKDQLTIPTDFLNWLNNQITTRDNDEKLEEKDTEQISFDNLLKQSRHKIFGNPLADRMKHFDDEL